MPLRRMTSKALVQAQQAVPEPGPERRGSGTSSSIGALRSPIPEQDEQDLAFYQRTLRRAEGDPGLRLLGLEVRPGCKEGDNFSSIVTRNTCRGVRGDGNGEACDVLCPPSPTNPLLVTDPTGTTGHARSVGSPAPPHARVSGGLAYPRPDRRAQKPAQS